MPSGTLFTFFGSRFPYKLTNPKKGLPLFSYSFWRTKVDKTVTVFTLSKAIVAALEDEGVSGVQRFTEMEELEKKVA